jgi:hypothetical protein
VAVAAAAAVVVVVVVVVVVAAAELVVVVVMVVVVVKAYLLTPAVNRLQTHILNALRYEPKPTNDEINFILAEVNRVLRDKVDRTAIRAAWCGLRPLVRDPNATDAGDTKKLSRHHVVDVVDGGLVTIAGGKWTTYGTMCSFGSRATFTLKAQDFSLFVCLLCVCVMFVCL